MPDDLAQAALVLATGERRRFDVGVCNGVYFNNSFAAGLDAKVTAKAVEYKVTKRRSGLWLYLTALLHVLFRELDSFSLRVGFDGRPAETVDTLIVAVTIGKTYGGGFFITPDAVPDDGLFDVCMIDPLSLPEALMRLPFVIVGRHTKMRPVHMSTHSRVVIECDQALPAQFDGEVLLEKRYDISILPARHRVRRAAEAAMTPVTGVRQLAGGSRRVSGRLPDRLDPRRLPHRAGVTGEDITDHGTGNVGSMNVRRTTGSWGWFALAVLGDGLKGLIPTLVAKAWATGVPVFSLAAFKPWSQTLASVDAIWWQQPVLWVPMAAVAGAVLGHNYSIWMALIEHGFARTGKGLATGAGALLAYDWRYFVAVVVVGLAVIAITPLHDGRTGRGGRHAADRGARARLARLGVRARDGCRGLRGAPQAVHGDAGRQGAEALHQRRQRAARLSRERRRAEGTPRPFVATFSAGNAELVHRDGVVGARIDAGCRTRCSRPGDSGGRRPRGRSSCSGTHRRRCRRRCRGWHQQQEGTWIHPFTRTKRFGHSRDSNLAARVPQSASRRHRAVGRCVRRTPGLPTAPCRRPRAATRSRTGRCGR